MITVFKTECFIRSLYQYNSNMEKVIQDLQDNQFWATVINSSANLVLAGSTLVQVIFIYASFKFGLEYLNQHREKIKEERTLTQIYNSIILLHELRIIWFDICQIPDFVYTTASQGKKESAAAIEEIRRIFMERLNSNEHRLRIIRSTLRTNSLIIENQLFTKRMKSLILLEEDVKLRFEKLARFPDEIRMIPKGIYEKGDNSFAINHGIQSFIDCLEKLYKNKE